MGRANVNRIDHIAICVRPENLEAAVADFSELLNITFEGPFPSQRSGITYYLDWSSGMEIYAPTDPDVAIDRVQHLERHGEGMFRLVFGVPDIASAAERARSMGHTVQEVTAFGLNPQWKERFDRMDEALLSDPVHGVHIGFSRIEPSEPELD